MLLENFTRVSELVAIISDKKYVLTRSLFNDIKERKSAVIHANGTSYQIYYDTAGDTVKAIIDSLFAAAKADLDIVIAEADAELKDL